MNSGNRIMFAFIQNGKSNVSITGLSFAESDGSPLNIGQERGFDNIRFPFNCKVTYTSLNSFQTASFQNIFEIRFNFNSDIARYNFSKNIDSDFAKIF